MKKNPNSRKLIVIVGPTAVGKSELAVELARKYGGEIISADSRQVYTGLDIGTGKVTKKGMHGIPHHLLDVTDPRRQFTVAKYTKLAQKALDDILARGKLPIICGGTGLYIDALLGRVLIPEVPPNPKLRKQLERKSVSSLFAMLQKLDPGRAETIDRHNSRRLVRAIEIATVLGRVPVRAVILKNNSIAVQPLYIGLTLPKNELKGKIALRLTARIDSGMIEEAKRLHTERVSWKRMEELGLEYRYVSRFLRGRISREEMVAELQSEIWHYAKRQMTWFKRNKEIRWFKPSEQSVIEEKVRKFIST
ncbi:MAG: tRNA (adenosine(37)-N6)-dimethylallyltransferase MiaA [Patescibacteria group bacterium]